MCSKKLFLQIMMRPSSEIRKKLEEKTGVLIGISTVHRRLPLMGISLKKTIACR